MCRSSALLCISTTLTGRHWHGNVATEDVQYMLDGMNLKTGLDMQALLKANRFITGKLGRAGSSRAAAALLTVDD